MAKSLKELLAEKKALQNPTQPVVTVDLTDAVAVKDKKEEVAPTQMDPTQENKPLTFAEKMALKKAATGGLTTGSIESPVNSPKPEAPSTTETGQSTGPVLQDVQAVAIPAAQNTGPEETEADPVAEQAYADISQKIELLESLEDTALEGAMKDLKKALMANPNAVSLMLDTDYGKMVVALRKLTREAAVEAAAEKKPGRKAKDKPLSAEQISAVFEEL